MSVDETSLKFLRDSARKKTPVFFSASSVDILFETNIIQVERNAVSLANRVTPDHISQVMASEKFYFQCHMSRFVTDHVESDGCHIVFPLEHLSVIEETRQAERFFFNTPERAVVEMINPYDRETTLRKAVMDLSESGLSIRTPFSSELFVPGTAFTKMKIYVDGKLQDEKNAKVIYRRQFLNRHGKNYCQVGFQFEP